MQKETSPRLQPINKPKSLKLKIAYWFTKRIFGKVFTPLKVHYSRFPEALGLSGKLVRLDKKFTIDTKLKHMIKAYVATINGCAFCVDIAKASAQRHKIKSNSFDDLLRFEESELFSEAHKAALAYVDESTRNKRVTDSTFERLQRYYNEREIVQITLLNAIENFYNLTNTPLNINSDELCKLMQK
ncbi:MAG: carboxymuconolactone decarboxylase family protein [Balneolales bacterium]